MTLAAIVLSLCIVATLLSGTTMAMVNAPPAHGRGPFDPYTVPSEWSGASVMCPSAVQKASAAVSCTFTVTWNSSATILPSSRIQVTHDLCGQVATSSTECTNTNLVLSTPTCGLPNANNSITCSSVISFRIPAANVAYKYFVGVMRTELRDGYVLRAPRKMIANTTLLANGAMTPLPLFVTAMTLLLSLLLLL